jgi:fructosamine-3-kinase
MTLDLKTNGPWEELEKIEERTLSHVIPRLIGALEVDGRSVKPCLIHADLRERKTGTSHETGEIFLFDAASFYAHNEMEIGIWRCSYSKMHLRGSAKTYFRNYGMSEPAEEWDDRNRMYSVYYDIIYSVNHMSQGRNIRQM